MEGLHEVKSWTNDFHEQLFEQCNLFSAINITKKQFLFLCRVSETHAVEQCSATTEIRNLLDSLSENSIVDVDCYSTMI